ncbi:hypothetical protein AOQ84DRAFT_352645 [Glonium stellatum]|uniref:Uncharacterized protein n=1 Tax=Glonium stellatum TaxID=574774 RepID=A0A8E2JWH8_9PEZI|nr:hypothetical protein AOQ84DRAFT_352645 [Glonium stellatum]
MLPQRNSWFLLVGISCFLTSLLFLLTYRHVGPSQYFSLGFKHNFLKAKEAQDDALNRTLGVWYLFLSRYQFHPRYPLGAPFVFTKRLALELMYKCLFVCL